VASVISARHTATTVRWCTFGNTIAYVLSTHGACPHFSRALKTHLDDRFAGRWIDCGGAENWPIRSLDLYPVDFYLWGAWKNVPQKSQNKMHCSIKFWMLQPT
jgi:hypothetical protein